MVTVHMPGALRQLFGAFDREPVDGATVAKAIRALDARYPGIAQRICEPSGALRPYVNVFLGTENVRWLAGVDTPLSAQRDLYIVPSVAGGATDVPPDDHTQRNQAPDRGDLASDLPGDEDADSSAVAVPAAWNDTRLVLLTDVVPTYADRVDTGRLAVVAAATLAQEGQHGDVEISLIVTNDPTIRQLNAEYRGVDRETDVLAYPQVLPGEPVTPAPDGVLRLGDIVLSYDRAVEQAVVEGHGTARELDVLMAHGVLHLLGYTDETPERKAIMLDRGNAALEQLAPG